MDEQDFDGPSDGSRGAEERPSFLDSGCTVSFPHTGDRLFAPLDHWDAHDGMQVVVEHALMFTGMGAYPDAYKEAADIVVEALDNGRNAPFSCERFLLPIAYLYRHAIELQLKDGIYQGLRIGEIRRSAELDETLNGHRLYPLWNVLKPVTVRLWSDQASSTIAAAESLINELHQLDPSGQSFRYPSAKDGTRALACCEATSNTIDLRSFAQTADKLYTFLDCCVSGMMDIPSEIDA